MSTAITPLHEMEFERRMEGLTDAQETLSRLGHSMLLPDVDEVIHAFITAYNAYEENGRKAQ